jgi:uncharacterized protein YndB with AHSA1/START domain
MTERTIIRPAPLELDRHFDAPRAVVFEAWSSAEHIKNWFSPEGLTTPQAVVEFRPGGRFEICMQAPDGKQYWSKGSFIEIVENEKLVWEAGGHANEDGTSSFHCVATITFADDGAGTAMSIHQAYEVYDDDGLGAVGGAPEGWRTTLDKLEREVARIKAG